MDSRSTRGAGHRRNDQISMGTLESDDCCGVGLTNYNPQRYAFEDHKPSASKAEWAPRPPSHSRDSVFNRFHADTSHEDAERCIDSSVGRARSVQTVPKADDTRGMRSFSTSSSNSSPSDLHVQLSNEDCRFERYDEDLLDHVYSLRISDEEVGEKKEDKLNESVLCNDVDDDLFNWDLIFEQDEDGDTQLHIAIMTDMQEDFALSVINLCQNAELLDLQNDLHQTVLHLAIVRRQMQIVQALLSRGTSLFVCDQDGNTPLHLACRMGYTEAVNAFTDSFKSHMEKEILLKVIHHRNYEGLTCCHLSAMSQAPDNLFNLTQDCGADINIQEGKRGMTVLHTATISNNEILVSFLIGQPNIDINELTYDGWTALDLAKGRRLTSIQQLLSCAGAITMEEVIVASSDSETSDLEDEETDDLVFGFQSLNTQ